MAFSSFVIRAALPIVLAGAAASSQAAACDGSSDPCTIELSTLTISFGQGAASYFADAQMTSGTDGYVNASPVMPTLANIDGGGLAGFSFTPIVSAALGGSGINGYFEASAYFEFHDLSFTAKPGYQIDALYFELSGEWYAVGDAFVYFGLPGGVPSTPGPFAISVPVSSTGDDVIRAEFTAGASYLEGPDGTAISYGTAQAMFGTSRLVAHVSAVPESGTALLMALGALALAGGTLRRRARDDRR